MTTRMLIDARHKEETRVAVVSGNKIEELDFESAEHKQIKGNIYLAKVTRVEPSLQAAFVDYGGNRQGFLAFSEIHPDYYQIPKEDREQLLAEEAAAAAEEAELREKEEAEDELAAQQGTANDGDADDSDDSVETFEAADDDVDEEVEEAKAAKPKRKRAPRKKAAPKAASEDSEYVDSENEAASDDAPADESAQTSTEADEEEKPKKPRRRRTTKTKSMIVDDSDNVVTDEEDFSSADDNASDNDAAAEGSDDDKPRNRRRRGNKGRNDKKNTRGNRQQRGRRPSDEVRAKRIALRRRYKIQDVIHRRQVLLVQVVKEERGNKGAALTSYLSLAGRYCVLMPNTSHGGGISRKINSGTDRKRLKSIVADMNLPVSMGCIIRTAGLSKTKVEIRRDFDYLARLWDKIRERTLTGAAPMLVHSDSDLIKRAIRDIYNRDISEVNIEGEEGFKAAKDFMKLLTPSHVKKLKQYTDSVPLFQRYGVEDQLNAMYHPIVQLKSGGYIVINPTEALVSIDINSGRSTKEHGIEATAVNTNLEAAREIARQLRLRDMAGLVVIDFIDMDHHSNSRKVERAMKDALRNDRARIQVGRISSFGLMEMSRQRLRTGVLEASTRECPHCEGTGLVRTSSSSALSALRMIEDESARGKGSNIELAASEEATIYVLNNKRAELADIESRYNVNVSIKPNGEVEGAKMTVSSSGPKPMKAARIIPITDDSDNDDNNDVTETSDEAQDENRGRRRRGRRGGRGRNNDRQNENKAQDENQVSDEAAKDDSVEASPSEKPKTRNARTKKTRVQKSVTDDSSTEAPQEDAPKAEAADEKPKRKRAPRKKAVKAEESENKIASEESSADTELPAKAAPKTRRKAAVKDADETEKTPVKKTRRRTKKSEEADTSEKQAAKSDEKPAAEKKPAAAKKTATKPKRATKASAKDSASKAGENKEEASDDSSAKGEGKPRKGWWQRTFG